MCTDTHTFSGTNYGWYWYRYFFWYYIFPIPILRLFSVTRFDQYRFQDFLQVNNKIIFVFDTLVGLLSNHRCVGHTAWALSSRPKGPPDRSWCPEGHSTSCYTYHFSNNIHKISYYLLKVFFKKYTMPKYSLKLSKALRTNNKHHS